MPKREKIVIKTKHAEKGHNSQIHLQNPKQISRNIISTWKKSYDTLIMSILQ